MNIIDVTNKLPKHSTKRYGQRLVKDIRYTVVHHSLTDNIPGDEDVYAFARYHVNNNDWPGIGYHYVIDADGTIYKTNSVATKSYHVGDYNRVSIGVCVVGNFLKYDPPKIQYKALIELLRFLQRNYPTEILGHSEVPGYSWKDCPVIDMNRVREDVELNKGLSGEQEVEEEIEPVAEGEKETSFIGIIIEVIKNIIRALLRR